LHRDSIVRLDDPINIDTFSTTTNDDEDEEANKNKNKNESLHRFTQHVAPIVLILYMIGHFLSTHHLSAIAALDDVGGGSIISIYLDPMFAGCVLISTGLFMMKWSVDQAHLNPM